MRRIAVFALVVSACATGTGVEPPTTRVSTSMGQPTAETTAPTTSAASTSTVTPAPSVCEGYAGPVALGTITDPDLVEISGIAIGSDGVIWVHNDSGFPPRLWALDDSGAVLGSLVVSARNIDWEDMSIGPGPGGVSFLYLADIGDNLGRRSSVAIHRFEEPSSFDAAVDEIESLVIRYPGGPADAEAFFVDPVTGDSFIVTKTPTGRSSVLRVPVGAWSQPSVQAQHIATIDLGALSLVTSGAISPNGSVVALRTYLDVWLWERGDGETVADALRGDPCEAPSAPEPQGEAVGFDLMGYFTVSEGTDVVIYRFEER